MRFSMTLKALLLAGAVLAPAVTLAVLGLRAYRAEALLLRERYKQDQAAIVRLVSGRLLDSASKALDDLESRSNAQEPDVTLESRFRAAHPVARHIFLVRGGRMVYPWSWGGDVERRREQRFAAAGYLLSDPDVRSYVQRLRERRRQAHLLARGLREEAKGQREQAARLYRFASRGRSDPAARALMGRARIARAQERTKEAAELYRELDRRFGSRQDSEGISYALLADVGLAEIGEPEQLVSLHERLLRREYVTSGASRRFYLRWTVERLSERARGDLRRTAERLRSLTRQLFAAEQFGERLRRHGVADLVSVATDRIGNIALDRSTILVLRRRGDVVTGYSLDEQQLRKMVASLQREVVPSGREIRLSLQRLGQPSGRRPDRVLYASVLDPPLGHWSLASLVPSHDPMGLLEERGGNKGLGLVMGLILVLLVGLLLTYRGVRRESELAQLKSDFASNVSHELKTPLTSIRMYAEMLNEGIAATATDQHRYHRVIIRESERLGRLIGNVLDFSRVERGTRRYDLQPMSLAELVREAVETFSRISEGETIAIRFARGGAALPAVQADREAVVQSVLNLLSNAAKYSLGHPTIDVDLVRRDDEVSVVVRDRGMGIAPAEQSRIFDDFYRAPESRKAGVEGTGLGLALVRRHMKACGGRVELESTPGEGSLFRLWFVASPEPDRSSKEPADVSHPDHRG